MTLETATFINSLIFFVGIVLLVAGSFPQLRERWPKLFLNGFMLTLIGIGLMVVTAFILG